MDLIDKYIGEGKIGIGVSRPRAGGGRHGELITARLAYHQFLMDNGMSSKDAFNKVKDLNLKDIKKAGYPNFKKKLGENRGGATRIEFGDNRSAKDAEDIWKKNKIKFRQDGNKIYQIPDNEFDKATDLIDQIGIESWREI